MVCRPRELSGLGLSKGPDEYVTLADAEMNEIDCVACPSMKRGESYGRVTDGAPEWQIFAAFTKGTPNEGPARQPVTNTMGLWVNEVFTNQPGYGPAPVERVGGFHRIL